VESDHRDEPAGDVEHARRVSVQGSAQPWLVPTVRTIAADLAGRADFDLDFISDLRMAVDEACAVLVGVADADEGLHCSIVVARDWISVDVSVVPGERGARVRTNGFGWRVLQSLVDEVSVHSGNDDAKEWLGIRLLKKQTAG